MSNISPASQAEATAALRALFTAFPSDRGDIPGISATYRMAVDGYSLKAIEGAVKRVIRGEVDDIDKRFLPSPAQLGNLVAFMEKLYTPPVKRIPLPAPGDLEPTEEEWERRKAQADAARQRFGIKPQFVGESVVDREAIPAARLAQLDQEVSHSAAKLKTRLALSAEAIEIFDRIPALSDEEYEKFVGERKEIQSRAVPDPSEQFDQWNERRAS